MRENFNGILILSDLDGTFFGKKASIVPKNIEAIKHFNSLGGRFTYSTGRIFANLASAATVASEIVNAPLSLANGSYVYDYFTSDVIDPMYISEDAVVDMINFAKANYPEAMYRISTSNGFYSEVYNPAYKNVVPGGYHIHPIEEWPRGNWLKLVFNGEAEMLAKLNEELKRRFEDIVCFSRSSVRLIEIQAKGCTKAARVPWFKDYYRRQGEDITIIACGDFDNDVEVLKAADISVCPSNATEEVKRICDYCLCDHSEGLIADLINKIEQGIIKI